MFGVFFSKQKTAYEMRISDWSSDVCSSDLTPKVATRRALAPTSSALPPNAAKPRRATNTTAKALPHRSSPAAPRRRSEEHTSELQSLMRSSYALFCLKKKNNTSHKYTSRNTLTTCKTQHNTIKIKQYTVQY